MFVNFGSALRILKDRNLYIHVKLSNKPAAPRLYFIKTEIRFATKALKRGDI